MAFDAPTYSGGGRSGRPRFDGSGPAATPTGGGPGAVSVDSTFRAQLSPEGARVTTGFGVSGLATLFALLVGLWAADRWLAE